MAKTPVVTRANKYYKRSRISEKRFRQLVRLFAQDLAASDVAVLTGLERKSVNTIYFKIRTRIAQMCEIASPKCVSANRLLRMAKSKSMKAILVRVVCEASSCARRTWSRSRRKDTGVWSSQAPLTGLHRNRADCQKATLQAIIRGRVAGEVAIHSDRWRGCNGLVDIGYAKHFRVNHGANEFALGSRHINGIESFWKVPNVDCKSSTVCRTILFISTLKNANGASTTGKTISTKNY